MEFFESLPNVERSVDNNFRKNNSFDLVIVQLFYLSLEVARLMSDMRRPLESLINGGVDCTFIQIVGFVDIFVALSCWMEPHRVVEDVGWSVGWFVEFHLHGLQ